MALLVQGKRPRFTSQPSRQDVPSSLGCASDGRRVPPGTTALVDGVVAPKDEGSAALASEGRPRESIPT